MSGPVFTKLHAALELMGDKGIQLKRGAKDRDEVMELLDAMASSPLYVMDFELSTQLDFKVMAKSVQAIYEAGRLRLPFPRMVLELWHNWVRTPKRDTASPGHSRYTVHRLFALVDEVASGVYDLSVVEYRDSEADGEAVSTIMRCRYSWNTGPLPGVEIFPPLKPGADPSELSGFAVSHDDDLETKVPDTSLLNKIFHELSIALSMGIMLVNIAGVERERVTPKASFNRARVQRGKPAIPDHTVVRIGHVYNSSGQRVAYDRGDGDRKPTVVHMRAAHSRRQQHGPEFLSTERGREFVGLPSTTDTEHVVLIDAVLVNYRDGTDLAKPLPKVVRF